MEYNFIQKNIYLPQCFKVYTRREIDVLKGETKVGLVKIKIEI